MSFKRVEYESKDKRPNVMLICVDQWPGQLSGAAGNSHIFTPNLNLLCKNGIRYSEAYSCTPSCIPARRELMTGTSAKTHGDRIFNEHLEMPQGIPTLAETFYNAGYQTYAVGKMHVYPQRNRIGFGDVLLCEEGRKHIDNLKDDYETFIDEQGYMGQAYMHGAGTNRYNARPWHLPEYCHPTYWTTKNICRTIQRRDPTKPSFWYASYIAPHPPVTPPRDYWDMCMGMEIDSPVFGDWSKNPKEHPQVAWSYMRDPLNKKQIDTARKAFYAQCTYIDQMIGMIIGTLREEKLLDNTIIMFTCDHGDMLGNHNMFAKSVFYEYSAKIHMILSVPEGLKNIENDISDDRLAELKDIMPTLLELCDISIPDTVEGHSLVSKYRRDYIYGEHSEDRKATRMVRKGAYKLIYYAVGNRFQLFNTKNDSMDVYNLYGNSEYSSIALELTELLIENLYGSDTGWLKNGKLIGLPDKENTYIPERGLLGQRGLR